MNRLLSAYLLVTKLPSGYSMPKVMHLVPRAIIYEAWTRQSRRAVAEFWGPDNIVNGVRR